MSIAENTALFSLVGTTYGGDGQVTFGLPDFRGRIAVGTFQGPGLSNIDLGQVGGSSNVTMTTANMPAHTHAGSVGVNPNNGTTNNPANAFPAVGNGSTSDGNTIQVNCADGNTDNTLMAGLTIMNTGAGQPFSVTNPYLGMNFIICTEGIYPSRS